jgi:hypothetical protein
MKITLVTSDLYVVFTATSSRPIFPTVSIIMGHSSLLCYIQSICSVTALLMIVGYLCLRLVMTGFQYAVSSVILFRSGRESVIGLKLV